MDLEMLEVKNNPTEKRFEAWTGENVAGFIAYRMQQGDIYVMLHTEVRAEYEGKGVAQKLVYHVLEQVKAEGGKIVPICPYISAYIERHPEYQDLVVPLRV